MAERLRERLPKIEQAAVTRLQGVSGAPERPQADYAEGLRIATAAALGYLIEGVESGDALSLRPPPAVLVQARVAAHNCVGLDVVLRRCFAGHTLFGDFLMGELERCERVPPELPKRLLRDQATLFDHMLGAVAEEYSREQTSHSALTEQRRTRLIERLLAGEPADAAELGYHLEAHHVGIVAQGSGAHEVLRSLASDLDRRLLPLERNDEVLWAWLGGRSPLDVEAPLRRVTASLAPEVRIAIGEPSKGPEGWRLTHRQAVAALPIARRGPETVVRYADAALVAAVLQDELLMTSLRHMYLEPLAGAKDGGKVLRETLRAYFATGRSVSSAAAALGLSRQAVNSRLRVVEEVLGQPLRACAAELEAVLRVEEFTQSPVIASSWTQLRRNQPGP